MRRWCWPGIPGLSTASRKMACSSTSSSGRWSTWSPLHMTATSPTRFSPDAQCRGALFRDLDDVPPPVRRGTPPGSSGRAATAPSPRSPRCPAAATRWSSTAAGVRSPTPRSPSCSSTSRRPLRRAPRPGSRPRVPAAWCARAMAVTMTGRRPDPGCCDGTARPARRAVRRRPARRLGSLEGNAVSAAKRAPYKTEMKPVYRSGTLTRRRGHLASAQRREVRSHAAPTLQGSSRNQGLANVAQMCSGQRQNRKTTGPLAAKGVQQLSRVRFEKIDDQGLHISVGSDDSGYQVLQHRNRVRGPEIGPRHRAGSSKSRGFRRT